MPGESGGYQRLREDDEFASTVRTVRAAADDGRVVWSDVADDVDPTQWGRLIDSDLLERAEGDGFRFRDPDAVDEALASLDGSIETDTDASGGSDTEELHGTDADAPDGTAVDDGTGGESAEDFDDLIAEIPDVNDAWTMADLLAAGGVLGLVAGHLLGLGDGVVRSLDAFLFPAYEVVPFVVGLTGVSLLVGAFSAVAFNRLIDHDRVARLSETTSKITDRLEEEDVGLDALERLERRREAAGVGKFAGVRLVTRPVPWVLLVAVAVFIWVDWVVATEAAVAGETVALPLLGPRSWDAGIVGPIPLWVVWYLVAGQVGSSVVKRAFGLRSPPTSGA